jgi:hypothetical protein
MNTLNIFINKFCFECNVYSKPKQGVEQGKLPCSASCSKPCSAHDEKLKVKIEKLKLIFSCFEAI